MHFERNPICTLNPERIWIDHVASEIVFLPLHPDTSAPLLEERVIAVYLLEKTSELSQMECLSYWKFLST